MNNSVKMADCQTLQLHGELLRKQEKQLLFKEFTEFKLKPWKNAVI